MQKDANNKPILTVDMPEFWQACYQQDVAGWNIGEVSTPIKVYIDHLVKNHTPKDIAILIAGAGNSYEAGYLYEQGFTNVYVVDFAQIPLDNFAKRYPDFSKDHLICQDFFNLNKNLMGKFDLAIEQTFFCAINPSQRPEYAKQMTKLIKPTGKLVGLLIDKQFESNPPFGGDLQEYETLFSQFFTIEKLEPCYNSIKPRQGSELFFEFRQKNNHH